MPLLSHFLILERVYACHVPSAGFRSRRFGRITEFTPWAIRPTALLLCCLLSILLAAPPVEADQEPRETFREAWQAAAKGDRARFEQAMPGLRDYLLFPYLQYEDFRHRRKTADVSEVAAFLDSHEDWAFAAGLKTAWLRSLGATGRWESVLLHAPGSADTEVQCHLANARLRAGELEQATIDARRLWTAGKSQPDACDPVFAWLQKQGAITGGLAWERIRLAIEARQLRLTYYLARFLPEAERVWLDRWQQQDRSGYRRLDRASAWGDHPKNRDITLYGIRRLARNDADRAWQVFAALDGHFDWGADARDGLLREIALWSAVDGAADTPQRMKAVPAPARDDQLLEWWARHELSAGRWEAVADVVDLMSPDLANDSRWRYWAARARIENGDGASGREQLAELALEANYYGFLAADRMNLPYTICPQEPEVAEDVVTALAKRPDFSRALELRRAGIRNWSRSEWKLATDRLDQNGLRAAAALATREDWPDRAIFALGDSGDRRWYQWRFPVNFATLAESAASARRLDSSWVMGLMRSESAMAEDAVSSAGALGLMQVMPGTARQLAKRHSLRYAGRSQLLQAEPNVAFGTAFLEELQARYGGNLALASGAYNAGPHVVDRWVRDRRSGDVAVWVDTLPYHETRDYIPRVLAFTTIYDWRLDRPVRRVSARMPALDSNPGHGTMQFEEFTEVVCRAASRT
ncbi:MAG: transglycosylase SLT domain-containing protein [Xanthomonadales bacterium]|nr:transglycosylase SLT domain-containing protein [Xanthomonadales bacterium]